MGVLERPKSAFELFSHLGGGGGSYQCAVAVCGGDCSVLLMVGCCCFCLLSCFHGFEGFAILVHGLRHLERDHAFLYM